MNDSQITIDYAKNRSMKQLSDSLQGILVVNTGMNLPAPRAAQMLRDMGAAIIKVEPPAGDTFEYFCRPWYEAMHRDVDVRRIDLKTAEGQAQMVDILNGAHILLTSQRPAALPRMGLDPAILQERHPQLAIVNIVGSPDDQAHLPGHDLTYQAQAGLVEPTHLPRSLIADLAGAQQAVIAALALLHAGGGVTQVALSEAAQLYHEPIAYEMTRPGDFLGGAHAGYNIYQTADGSIALAALELYFWPALHDLFPGLPDDPLSEAAHRILAEGFRQRPTAFWVTEARARDIPLEPIA